MTTRIVYIAVLMVMLHPILGPFIDHHHAERLLTHTHIFLEGADIHHEHLVAVPHHHGDNHGGEENEHQDENIIFMPTNVLTLVSFATLKSFEPSRLAVIQPEKLIGIVADDIAFFLHAVSIAPPTPPPRS